MNVPSEDQVIDMLSNPNVAQTMSEALGNPAFVDFIMQQNPLLRDNPQARQMLQSPQFRAMMTNPETLRAASRVRQMMGDGSGGMANFPAPGATDTTPAGAPAAPAAGAQPPNPFRLTPGLFGVPPAGAAGAGAGAQANPFLALFGQAPGAAPAAGNNAGGANPAAGAPRLEPTPGPRPSSRQPWMTSSSR